MSVNPIPEHLETVTPYLCVKGGLKLIEFLKNSFDATVLGMLVKDGFVRHAQVKVGTSVIMISDVMPGFDTTPAMLYVYVNDVDATFKKAVAAGGKSEFEPANQFYGDRSGCVSDGFGNKWCIASRIEDLSYEEIEQRTPKYKI